MEIESLENATQDGGVTRSYELRDNEGCTIKSLGESPSLHEIREASRKNGDPLERIDILTNGFQCSSCDNPLKDRFSADQNGGLTCWNCSMDASGEEEGGVTKNSDPTKAILSESGLYHKSLCDYVINVATGCRHGCKFCYVPSTPNIRTRTEMLNNRTGVEDGQSEWGGYLLYRDDLPERLSRKLGGKQTWKETDRGRGVVMLSSGTDCYQDRRTAHITRGCVTELIKHDRYARILTRSPAVCRDIDLFKASNGLVTVGSSIPSFNEEEVRAIETRAPPPSSRLNALRELSSNGVRTYVSMSPTYPTQDKDDLRELMTRFSKLETLETVFHEPINPRGENFDMTVRAAKQAGQSELSRELDKLKEKENWIEYSLNHLRWVEELGYELDIDVHLWPDKHLIEQLEQRGESKLASYLQRWRQKTSPENFKKI